MNNNKITTSSKGSLAKIFIADLAAAQKIDPGFPESPERKNIPLGAIPRCGSPALGRGRPRAHTRPAAMAGGGLHRLARDAPIAPYGLWRLKEARQDMTCTLIMGMAESDGRMLWHQGFCALALPGATVNRLKASHRRDILRVFIHQNPDARRDTFVNDLTRRLVEIGFQGEIRVFASRNPSTLYREDPTDFPLRFQEILDSSRPGKGETTRRKTNPEKGKPAGVRV